MSTRVRIRVTEYDSPRSNLCIFTVDPRDLHLLKKGPRPHRVQIDTGDVPAWSFVQDRLPSIRYVLLNGEEPPVSFVSAGAAPRPHGQILSHMDN